MNTLISNQTCGQGLVLVLSTMKTNYISLQAHIHSLHNAHTVTITIIIHKCSKLKKRTEGVCITYLYRLYTINSTTATTPTIIKMIITVMKNPRASLLYPSPIEEKKESSLTHYHIHELK